MDIATLLSPRSVIAELRATAKQALQELAYRAAAASGLHGARSSMRLGTREAGVDRVGRGIAFRMRAWPA